MSKERRGLHLIALVTLPWILVALVALYSPDNILNLFPEINSFKNIVANNIPSVLGYVGLSDFPQVTMLVLLFCWGIFPIQLAATAFIIIRYGDTEKIIIAMRKNNISKIKLMVCVVFLVIAILWSLLFNPKDPGVAFGFGVAHSKVGLALFVPFQFWLLCSTVGIALKMLFVKINLE